MPTSVFWDHILTSFFGNLPATITAVAALIYAVASFRQSKKTHDLVNSGQVSRDAAMMAQGQLKEQEEERQREKP